MDTTLDPRWQAALDHSRYLTNLFFARPELIAELAASWEQPLSEQLLQALARRLGQRLGRPAIAGQLLAAGFGAAGVISAAIPCIIISAVFMLLLVRRIDQ
mgnify:CR=1 FL=1